MPIRIHRPLPEDVPGVVRLIAEVEEYYGSTFDEQLDDSVAHVERALFGHAASSIAIVASDGDDIVGLASYSFLWPAAGTTESLWLKELFVSAPYRRRGIATQLLSQVREAAIERGCSRINWTMDAGYDEAEAFYKSVSGQRADDKIVYNAAPHELDL